MIMSDYHIARKTTAALSVMILLAVAVSPVFMEEETDDSDAVIFVAPVVIAALPYIELGVMAAGAALGAYFAEKASSGNSSDVEEYSAEVSITELTNFLNELVQISQPYMAISTDLLAKTQMAFSRESEVAAAHYWGLEKSFDDYSDDILEYAGVMNNLSNYYRSVESVFDTFTDGISSWPAKSADRGYTGISWNLYVDGTSYPVDSQFSLDFGTIVSPSGSSSRVYLAPQGSESTSSMSSLVVIESGTLISDSGNRYTLSPGTYELSAFDSGYYTLAGGKYFGPFLPTGSDSAPMTVGLRVSADGTAAGYISLSGDDVAWTSGSTSMTVTDFGISGSYEDFTKSASLTDYVRAWDAAFDEISSIIANAESSAEAEWMLFDSIGSANAQASLVAYYPDLSNLQLTAEQKFIIGAVSLVQNANWYAGTDDAIQAKDMSFSGESLQLKAVGSIRDGDGDLLADSVVFTPFVWLRDVMLYEGGSVVLDQPAMAMVWSGDNGDADMQLITLTSGMTLEISYLMYDGVEVSSVPLEVKQIDLALADYTMPEPVPVPDPENDDLKKIVLIVMVLLGVFLIMAGLRRFSLPIILIGAALVVIGYFWSGAIANALQDLMDWFGGISSWGHWW